jgi:1-acyl-sn-glycerol-3-phosphate acyltransferase
MGETQAMIVANHVSWIDIFLISSVRPTRFVAKS